MGRSDYILGKIQLIFWIPISLQNFWKCHHGGCVLYFITLVRLVTLVKRFALSECSLLVLCHVQPYGCHLMLIHILYYTKVKQTN